MSLFDEFAHSGAMSWACDGATQGDVLEMIQMLGPQLVGCFHLSVSGELVKFFIFKLATDVVDSIQDCGSKLG